jgi:hypothetical protein
MKKCKNLPVVLFFLFAVQQINFAQSNVNNEMATPTSMPQTKSVKVFALAGVWRDSIVHIVWENFDDINIRSVVLEASDDGKNFTPTDEALIADLIDIHLYNYPNTINYYNAILLSTEIGRVRFIYNDIYKNRDLPSHPVWYRVKMRTLSGDTYISQTFNSKGEDLNGDHTISDVDDHTVNTSTPKLQAKSKAACFLRHDQIFDKNIKPQT